MRIVGLVGPKQAGKDTSADLLKEMKKSSGKIAFAAPLKRLCAEIFNIPMNYFTLPELKEKPLKEPITLNNKTLRNVKNRCIEIVDPMLNSTTMRYNPHKASIVGIENRIINTPRELLQVVGTDYIRNRIFENWHVCAAVGDQVLAKLAKSGVYCVTDIRFLNEYKFLVDKFEANFDCYYIERPKAEKALKKATHASELEVLNIRDLLEDSKVIFNDGTIKSLQEKLENLELKPEVKINSKKVTEENVDIIKSGRFVFKKR